MRDTELVIVGAGVAGLTAALTAARQGLGVVVVDRAGVGGQVANAERIENVPGFPQGVGGHELGPLIHEPNSCSTVSRRSHSTASTASCAAPATHCARAP
jgi:thioredoxin reductase